MPQRPLVLIVDDDADSRTIAHTFLELRGWEVMAAADGHEALRLARARPPDLVVLDLVMPGLDGWGVAAALRADASTRRVPILALTAAAGKHEQDRALEVGCDAVLHKPIALTDLAAHIDALLGARSV